MEEITVGKITFGKWVLWRTGETLDIWHKPIKHSDMYNSFDNYIFLERNNVDNRSFRFGFVGYARFLGDYFNRFESIPKDIEEAKNFIDHKLLRISKLTSFM